MCCPANFCWQDARPLSELGLHGGGVLARTCLPEGGVAGACCDQSAAFSYISVPEWMSYWQCSPPVRAGDVWTLLPADLRGALRKWDYVFPRYLRLAMGSSYSVRILMLINITRIGRVLWHGQLPLAKGSRANEGPDVWLREIQELRRRPYRTLVVLHQYSGRRRWGDVEYWAKELASEHAWGLHFTSADSGTAPAWKM